MKKLIKELIGPKGIVVFNIFIIISWFRNGLLFAGAEEQLTFNNYTKSLELFSHIWYAAGTGYVTFSYLPRIFYFSVFEPLYNIGISNILLEAITFLILILIGCLSVFFLVKETVSCDLNEKWKRQVPFLASIFYFFNPFSVTQVWGRGLTFQFFAFALIPSFLLFFILSTQRKKLLFVCLGAIVSFILSSAYNNPAIVVTSWASIGLYLVYYIFVNRRNIQNITFAFISLTTLFVLWILLNFFWLYPIFKHGTELLSQNISAQENIISLKGLAPNSQLQNVLRLIHREYYDGTFNGFSNNIFIPLLSWFLPITFLFSISTLKKSKYFIFYILLFLTSVFIAIGANFPTGWLLIWLFEHFPILQVLRNPYEKFGINLVLAYSPIFATGLVVFCEKLRSLYKFPKIEYFFAILFTFLQCVVLVWPIWNRSFAGGIKSNFWVEIPKYYAEANTWLNSHPGSFNILHLPLLPEDGITYKWEHPYEGIEASEYIFDKGSISRNFGINKAYHSALLTKFGANTDYKKLPYWSDEFDNLDDDKLYKILAKLNVRFIILHFDTDYIKRKGTDPEETRRYLKNLAKIEKINQFGYLEIYKVDIPSDIDLIYSPNLKINFKKINTSSYIVDIKDAKEETDVYFLQQFHPAWKAFIDGEEVQTHTKAYSYANKWITNKQGSYKIEIKFIPQQSVELGTKITLVTLVCLLVFLLYYLLRIRKLLF